MRKANFFDILLLYLGFRRRFLVSGNSMLPLLKDGDEVLIKPGKVFEIGDVILAEHPFRKTKIIKRISEISTGGKVFLAGDNPGESSDSRIFGEIASNSILGKVICRLT